MGLPSHHPSGLETDVARHLFDPEVLAEVPDIGAIVVEVRKLVVPVAAASVVSDGQYSRTREESKVRRG